MRVPMRVPLRVPAVFRLGCRTLSVRPGLAQSKTCQCSANASGLRNTPHFWGSIRWTWVCFTSPLFLACLTPLELTSEPVETYSTYERLHAFHSCTLSWWLLAPSQVCNNVPASPPISEYDSLLTYLFLGTSTFQVWLECRGCGPIVAHISLLESFWSGLPIVQRVPAIQFLFKGVAMVHDDSSRSLQEGGLVMVLSLYLMSEPNAGHL